MHRRGLLMLPLALALLSSACGGDGGAAAVGSPTSPPAPASSVPSSTPDPTTSAAPSPTPTAVPSPELEDGKHFGYIRSVDASGQPATLVLDLAYMLTGEDAAQAAKEHGDEYPPPNDYYIVNDNPKLRTLILSPDVRIRVLDWANCCQTFFAGDLTAFADGFAHPDPAGAYRGPTSPYWLWVKDGQVVRIQEQYLP